MCPFHITVVEEVDNNELQDIVQRLHASALAQDLYPTVYAQFATNTSCRFCDSLTKMCHIYPIKLLLYCV